MLYINASANIVQAQEGLADTAEATAFQVSLGIQLVSQPNLHSKLGPELHTTVAWFLPTSTVLVLLTEVKLCCGACGVQYPSGNIPLGFVLKNSDGIGMPHFVRHSRSSEGFACCTSLTCATMASIMLSSNPSEALKVNSGSF